MLKVSSPANPPPAFPVARKSKINGLIIIFFDEQNNNVVVDGGVSGWKPGDKIKGVVPVNDDHWLSLDITITG